MALTGISLSESAAKLGVTEEELKKALEHYHKVKARRRSGKSYTKKWADMTPEQKQRALEYAKRRRIRDKLLVQKALAAGITVTDEEIDEAMFTSSAEDVEE